MIAPLLQSIARNQTLNVGGVSFDKVKVFVILPQTLLELNQITDKILDLERFEINSSEANHRKLLVSGKQIGNHQLILFDTPSSWIAGLSYLVQVESFSENNISKLLHRMTGDIKSYIKKTYEQTQFKENLMFISLTDFQNYYA